MTAGQLYKCSKCGKPTHWDESLEGIILCRDCWDSSIETDPARIAYMKAYNRAYCLVNLHENRERARLWNHKHRQKVLQRAKLWRQQNQERYNENQRLLMRQRRGRGRVSVTT